MAPKSDNDNPPNKASHSSRQNLLRCLQASKVMALWEGLIIFCLPLCTPSKPTGLLALPQCMRASAELCLIHLTFSIMYNKELRGSRITWKQDWGQLAAWGIRALTSLWGNLHNYVWWRSHPAAQASLSPRGFSSLSHLSARKRDPQSFMSSGLL